MSAKNGETAFPLVYDDIERGARVVYTGMSLRDWFAGQALVAIPDHYPPDQIVKMAYHRADLMLKERAK